jgi:hypothetical protein
MIFLRLVYVLRVPFRGSKYDTYRSRACSPVYDRIACSVGRHATEILAFVQNAQ